MENRLRATDNSGRSLQNIMKTKSAEIGANIASQGTSRVIFDSVTPAAVPQQVIRFFSQNRAFPNTNFSDQFEAGEAMIATHLIFGKKTFENNFFTPIDFASNDIRQAYFTVKIANSQVIKETCFGFFSSYVSIDRNDNEWLPLESGLFIPPQIDFEVTLYLNAPLAEDVEELACFVAGLGSLLNVKNY
jgi:hypothetical protein